MIRNNAVEGRKRKNRWKVRSEKRGKLRGGARGNGGGVRGLQFNQGRMRNVFFDEKINEKDTI